MPQTSPENSPVRAPLGLEALARSSPSLEGLFEGAARAARSEAPILILGEPGTGRSTLARALHSSSPRAHRPRIEVDAGLVPSPLFESELFGYVAGAFTGAGEDGAGRVALADSGTLVLDHVEEIPVDSQAKLLRLLAERRYAPLGGQERAVDVRFVAIASEDLEERVEQGTFRKDLFYRLEVVTLRLPALRDRLGDLEGVVESLLEELGHRFARSNLKLAKGSIDWMRQYDWPGNLRELRNCLEREVVISGGEVLDPQRPAGGAGPPATLAVVEKEHIRRSLAFARGHQGRAAQILGISRKTLWEKRRRYGLP